MFGPIKALSSLTKPTADNKAITDALRKGFGTQPVFMQGRLIEADLGTSVTKLNHSLGKAWTGYLVIAQDAAGVVYYDSATNTQPGVFIPLKASTAVHVKLWVF